VVKFIVAVDRHFKHCNVECGSHEASTIVAHLDSILRRRPHFLAADQQADQPAVRTGGKYDVGRQRHRST